ncbi:MAG: DUF1045 domain-containing protein [Rhodobacteraceae bacterium]|nr:DUF1045 domain-containing protein [Paracoccaceae bacterium]
MEFTRYALYWLPPADADWSRFATAWLGWDIRAGRPVTHPPVDGLPRPAEEITRAPRRYGLHATMKPPFRLAAGQTRKQLEAACADLCAGLEPLSLPGLQPTRLGRFLALCPAQPGRSAAPLAARCVRALDRFRAPMARDERDRRAAGLPPRLARNLAEWGNPHVMNVFRFHITLTAPLPPPDLARVEAALSVHLAPLLPAGLDLCDLSLVGEGTDGRFRLLHRFHLGK